MISLSPLYGVVTIFVRPSRGINLSVKQFRVPILFPSLRFFRETRHGDTFDDTVSSYYSKSFCVLQEVWPKFLRYHIFLFAITGILASLLAKKHIPRPFGTGDAYVGISGNRQWLRRSAPSPWRRRRTCPRRSRRRNRGSAQHRPPRSYTTGRPCEVPLWSPPWRGRWWS